MKKRAAHFLLTSQLVDNPSNNALISALLALDYAVDLYSPTGQFDVSHYGPGVTTHHAEYGYRWLGRNLVRARWGQYTLFSGTTEDPMAVAGTLARIYRRPCITMADEIKSGSYAGNRGARWKALCRSGMRAAALTVVNDSERIEVQRAYAGLSERNAVIVVPNCFRDPPTAADRLALRRARGFPDDALVVCYSGVFTLGNGGLWFAAALAETTDAWFWGQVVHQDPLVNGLLPRLKGSDRLVLEPGPLGWRYPWASMAAADIGMVVYLQDAPQFRHMGVASNRLCMFLTMGVPVIASRQPSFKFIEDYNCGVLLESPEEISGAVEAIRNRLSEMKANAMRCSKEYINASEHYAELVRAISRLSQEG